MACCVTFGKAPYPLIAFPLIICLVTRLGEELARHRAVPSLALLLSHRGRESVPCSRCWEGSPSLNMHTQGATLQSLDLGKSLEVPPPLEHQQTPSSAPHTPSHTPAGRQGEDIFVCQGLAGFHSRVCLCVCALVAKAWVIILFYFFFWQHLKVRAGSL